MAQVVEDLIQQDERVVLVLADISVGHFKRVMAKHPQRVINVGIMEQTAVSVAAGFAMEGFIPIVHSIVPFIVERPFEQIKDDFCYQGLGGTIISTGASFDYGTDGMTHHGPADVPILCHLPRMEVVVPGAASELETLLRETYADGAPTYIRLSAHENESGRPVRFGRLHVERQGREATILAIGPMLQPTLDAVQGLDVTVLYATTVSPFDRETLRESAATTGNSLMLIEPYYEGTLVSEVVAALGSVRMEAIGVPRRVMDRYGPPERFESEIGLDSRSLRARVEMFLRRS